MASKASTNAAVTSPEPGCLVQTVTEVMRTEPALEAVKIDRSSHSISVATLGKPHQADLDKQLGEKIQRIQQNAANERCRLLEGDDNCDRCTVPHEDFNRHKVTVQSAGGVTTISRVTCPTAPKFWRWHNVPLPRLMPRRVVLPEEEEGHENEWKWQLLAAGLCGLFGLLAYFSGAGPVATGFYVAAYVAGAWFTVEEVWERLQERILDVHFLMLAVAAGSASIGAWAEGATLLFLFSLSGALEHYAMGRTQREIRSLFKAAPKEAVVLDALGNEQAFPVDQLTKGMRLRVKPGELFAVDAEIYKGKTAADESNLTGEATPVEKGVGDNVLAGTLNQWGVVEVEVLRPASQSALQKIIHLIKEAQHLKAPSQQFTDKFGTTYTYSILSLSLVMFFVWWLGMGYAPFVSSASAKSAFYRAMTLLVVASPCALVLSIPSAILASIAWAAKRGILFRGGAAVEKLKEITVVAMDKTGTLTTGELQVDRVESFPAGREHDVLRLAYALEKLSTHPLARAVTRYGKQHQVEETELEQFESITGLGLKAQWQGREVQLGRREWLAAGPHAESIGKTPPTEAGFSEMWVVHGDLLGRVLLRDDVRPQSRVVVEELRRLGLKTLVLTGDRRATAEKLRQELDLNEVRAELKPEQKVNAIVSLTQANERVAMIGDGVNDAPSLAAAHVGVAMGARGADAALEQADIVLMHDRLENFLTAFRLSARASVVIKQNLVISLGTVAVLVVLALLGVIPLTAGVIGHEGSTVIVVGNSLRLLLGAVRESV